MTVQKRLLSKIQIVGEPDQNFIELLLIFLPPHNEMNSFANNKKKLQIFSDHCHELTTENAIRLVDLPDQCFRDQLIQVPHLIYPLHPAIIMAVLIQIK